MVCCVPGTSQEVHMSQLATFFNGSDTRLGVFYPEHFLIAIFPDVEQAMKWSWFSGHKKGPFLDRGRH
jgi:hypothetical protein